MHFIIKHQEWFHWNHVETDEGRVEKKKTREVKEIHMHDMYMKKRKENDRCWN